MFAAVKESGPHRRRCDGPDGTQREEGVRYRACAVSKVFLFFLTDGYTTRLPARSDGYPSKFRSSAPYWFAAYSNRSGTYGTFFLL